MKHSPSMDLDHVWLMEELNHTGRRAETRAVLADATQHLPCDRYMICGAEQDRRCLIDLFTGRREQAAGRLMRVGRVSYPIGRIAPFSLPIRGREFVRFLGEMYDFSAAAAIHELEACLPDAQILSTRMDRSDPRDRLAMSIAVAPFLAADIVLIDGALAHPSFPDEFVRHIHRVLEEIVPGRLLLVSTRQFQALRPIVRKGLHVRNGQIWVSDDITIGPGEIDPQAAENVEEELMVNEAGDDVA